MIKMQTKEIIISILIGCILALIVIYMLDKKIEHECSSCDASYSWCEGYWEESHECGR